MIQIEKDEHDYSDCQACHAVEKRTFNIFISDRGFEQKLHLCQHCCKDLQSLLQFTQSNDVKAVSIDEIDK